MLEFFVGFLFGLFVAGCSFIGYGIYQVNKIKKVKAELLAQLKEKVGGKVASPADEKKKETIKDRLLQASEIARNQMGLRSQVDAPSKNALHSKYKNGLVAEIQDLEQRKLDLLRTVLAEGYDPIITVVNETGSTEEIALSEYVNQAAGMLSDATGTPPPPPIADSSQPRKAGKFVVYKGGKDDGTTH